jgi:diguanylate cyclase (GGDEF)-like protein
MATHDHLTGLPNRAGWMATAAHLLNTHQVVTLAFADVNAFKTINDRYGHTVGDNVLRDLGHQLTAAFGQTAGRLGGEEFAVVVPGAMNLLPQVRAVTTLAPTAVRPGVTAAIGVVTHGQGENLSDLLRRADNAMYTDKRTA